MATNRRPRLSSSACLRAVLGLAVVALLLVGGPAAGWWSAAGAGASTGSTGVTADLTLAPATPSAQLYPGGTGDVVLTITNPNDSSVRVGSLDLATAQGTGGYSVDGAHSACGVGSLTYTPQTNGGAGWTVPGNGSTSVTLTGALAMSVSAANSCQGATFTVYLQAPP
jgi:hypothetical protein